MKRAIIFVSILTLAVICISAVCVWLAPPPEQVVVPPSRFGSSSMSLGRFYTFSEAALEADVVAHIRVGNWLGDNDDGWTTSFAAEAVTVYKGDLPAEFVLIQDGKGGDGEERAKAMLGYPLFTHGNELFLFLKEALVEYYGIEYHENSYYIFGSHPTVYYIGQAADGESYAVPSFSNHFSEGIADSGAVLSEVAASLAANDPEMWSGAPVTGAYSVADLGARVQEICAAE